MPRQLPSLPGRTRPLGLAALAALALAACSPDRAVTGSTYPTDSRVRHPIVLTDAPRTLDVFVNGPGGLDPRQRQDVQAFALEYRRYGRGALVAQLPTGTGLEAQAHRTLGAVREALAQGGLPGEHLAVSTYPIADPAAASAIRLSFRRMQAKVAGKCGLWPQDLGVSDYGADARNEPYWNLGCATQANVAAQIADPVDLVRGRQEGRVDTIRRSKVIETLREGKDPSTPWRQDGQTSSKQQASQ